MRLGIGAGLNNLLINIFFVLGLNDGLRVALRDHRRGAFCKVSNSKLLDGQIDEEDKFAVIFPRYFAIGEVNAVAIVGEI